MTDALCATMSLPDLVQERLRVLLQPFKNRDAAMVLAAWIVSRKCFWRTRKGFHLVRGSDPKVADGLKEDPDLKKFGMTSDKIRGAIKTLTAVCFMDCEMGLGGATWNFRSQYRKPPSTYRVCSQFVSLLRKAQKEVSSKIEEARAEAAASESGSGTVEDPICVRENPYCAPPKCSSFQDKTGIVGEKGSGTAKDAPLIVREARPAVTAFDAHLDAILAKVGITRPRIEAFEPPLKPPLKPPVATPQPVPEIKPTPHSAPGPSPEAKPVLMANSIGQIVAGMGLDPRRWRT